MRRFEGFSAKASLSRIEMARLNLATLGRIVPEWGQPFARRALSSVRVNFERFGLTAVLERGYRRRLITHAQSRAAPRIRRASPRSVDRWMPTSKPRAGC